MNTFNTSVLFLAGIYFLVLLIQLTRNSIRHVKVLDRLDKEHQLLVDMDRISANGYNYFLGNSSSNVHHPCMEVTLYGREPLAKYESHSIVKQFIIKRNKDQTEQAALFEGVMAAAEWAAENPSHVYDDECASVRLPDGTIGKYR